jgi:hypothetical protein
MLSTSKPDCRTDTLVLISHVVVPNIYIETAMLNSTCQSLPATRQQDRLPKMSILSSCHRLIKPMHHISHHATTPALARLDLRADVNLT